MEPKMMDNDGTSLNRKQFLRLSSGIIGGLAIPGVPVLFGNETIVREPAGHQAVLDETYLALGLTAMARAKGWFDAHWGAGVIAGYYLCMENRLNDETIEAIKGQLDTVIRVRAAQFASLPREAADEALIARVADALLPAIEGGLRAHGHAVIFASLSTKALRDVPSMAQPTLINALCGLSRQIARKKPQPPTDDAGAKPYADTQAMIEATFDSLARFKDLVGRPSIRRPNFTHMTTHTEALMNLEAMGYANLARLGHAGHRVHIGAPVPKVVSKTDVSADRATLESVMRQGYWDNKENHKRWKRAWHETDNRNGDWIAAGHLFKVLYSYHRLINRINDPEKVKLCSRILLERYLNPEVRGG